MDKLTNIVNGGVNTAASAVKRATTKCCVVMGTKCYINKTKSIPTQEHTNHSDFGKPKHRACQEFNEDSNSQNKDRKLIALAIGISGT
jgi:hypothetical protein